MTGLSGQVHVTSWPTEGRNADQLNRNVPVTCTDFVTGAVWTLEDEQIILEPTSLSTSCPLDEALTTVKPLLYHTTPQKMVSKLSEVRLQYQSSPERMITDTVAEFCFIRCWSLLLSFIVNNPTQIFFLYISKQHTITTFYLQFQFLYGSNT